MSGMISFLRKEAEEVAHLKTRNILHLKGFGRGIDFQNERTRRHAGRIVEMVRVQAKRTGSLTLVWDGDSFEHDSFTRLIGLVQRDVAGVHFCSFLRECDKHRFEESWRFFPANIHVVLMPAQFDWKLLGIQALRITCAKTILSFGGGPIALMEYEDSKTTKEWTIFDVQRRSKDGSTLEDSALLNAQLDSNLTNVVR